MSIRYNLLVIDLTDMKLSVSCSIWSNEFWRSLSTWSSVKLLTPLIVDLYHIVRTSDRNILRAIAQTQDANVLKPEYSLRFSHALVQAD